MSLPVTVRESVERGRDLVATEQLGAGRVVLTAAPLAAVPSDAFALSVCCGCLRHCSPSRRCPSCGAVLLCEGCATPGHRHALLHADECDSLRQLREDPVVRQRSRRRTPAAGGGRTADTADTSGLRLLLRLVYAARRERLGTMPPLQLPQPEQEVIEDDFEAMASLEDHSHLFPADLSVAVSDAAARAKYLLSPSARMGTDQYEGFLARVFCNSFALHRFRDPHGRTRQPKAEVGSGVFPSIALMNHSCGPNCEVELTDEGFLRVVTREDVAAGDALTLSYLPLPIPPPPYGVAGRHRDLKNAFFFECDCGLEDEAG